MMATETKTFYPGEYDASISSYNSLNNPTNAVGKGSDNTGGYTQIGARSGKPANCYWPFAVSVIPQDAEIESVSCVARAAKATASGMSASLQLSAGTSLKGSPVAVTATNAQKYTISGGAWTRSELETIRLRTYATTSGTSSRSILFYGADLTVTYTYQSEKFMLKLSGSYHDIARVFQKIDGIWIEQDDLNNVVVSENGLVNGGEIESSGPVNPSFTIGGNIYYFEDGMTGEEWVDSSYNPLGLYVGNHIFHGPLVFYDDGAAAIVDATETYVNHTWLVAENHAYSLYYL